MAQQPNSQMPLLPQRPRRPSDGAAVIGEYVKAFVLLVIWIVLGTTVCGAAYVAIRAILWGVGVCTEALGV